MSAADGIDWTSAGPLAVAFAAGGIAFAKEWIIPGKTFQRELRRSRDSAKQVETLQAAIQDEFLPAFRESTDALKAVTPLLNPQPGTVGSSGGGG